MHSQNIQLKDLHVSPLNMRAEKKQPSLKRMAEIAANILPTVREKGILQDLIVRKNNAGFEILAGRRRFYSALVVESERGDFPPLPCKVLDETDDASAIEASLIENVAREDVDEISAYETYAALIHEGRTVDEIARTFGKTDRQVTQSLAVANLLPRIRDLYRSEELDAGDLQLLTMATKTQQRDWLKLHGENDAPFGNGLKGWLFGGEAIATRYALFDLATFPGKVVGDLFSEQGEGYFASMDAFWQAQDEAIAARRDAYLAAGWKVVEVMERGKHFPQWDFVKASKKSGGWVIIEPTHTGEVRFHEGYLSQAEASRAEKKADKAQKGEVDDEPEKPQRSPITSTMQNYLDLTRHAAVRLAVIARPSDALRLMIAHAVAASGNWSVKPDARRADSQAVRESAEASEAEAIFATEAEAIRKLLAPAFKGEAVGEDAEEEGDTRVAGRAYQDSGLTMKVFQRLLKLKDADVARIAAFVMAETLHSGDAVVDGFGHHAKVNIRDHWAPDQTFFDLMRDRASVNTMLSEVAGKKTADKLVSAKLKDQRNALAAAAAEAPQWVPEWLRFPAIH
jgi:ParB family chromosome partitioning protein